MLKGKQSLLIRKKSRVVKNLSMASPIAYLFILFYHSLVRKFLNSAEIRENIGWKNFTFRFVIPNLSYHSKLSIFSSNSRNTLLSVIKSILKKNLKNLKRDQPLSYAFVKVFHDKTYLYLEN